MGSCGIALNSTTRKHPRLGLVAGSRGPTQIHIRGLCHWAGEPRATSAPSHRADEPPGPQAPGKQARLVHTDRTDRSGRGTRMQCPSASVLCLSPPLVALLLTPRTLGHSQGPKPPRFLHATAPARLRLKSHRPHAIRPLGRYGGARAIRDSPSDVGACLRVVRGQTCFSPVTSGDRCERHKRTSRTWSGRWPASPKGRIGIVRHEARRSSEEFMGSHKSHRPNYESPRFAMV